MSEVKEIQLTNLISEQGVSDVSPDLSERIVNLARHHDQTLRHKRAHASRVRFAFVAGFAGMLVIATIALSPSLVAAHSLNTIVNAVDGATSMHLRQFDITKGTPEIAFEEWYQNGNWKLQQADRTSIWRSGVQYVFSAASNTVLKSSKPIGPFAQNPRGFKMSQLLVGIDGSGRTPDVSVTTLDNGTYRLQVDNKPVNERYIFIVDSKSDLPKTMDVQKPEKGGWVTKMQGTIEFNKTFSADTFEPNFPKSAKRIDTDVFKENLSKGFTKTVAELKTKEMTFKIHDIEANTRGHLFIVYDGGALGAGQEWVELTDEKGVPYVKSDKVNIGMTSDHPIDLSGGHSMNFEWWIPTEGAGTFHPHQFKLTLKKQVRTQLNKKPWYTPETDVIVGATSFRIDSPSTSDVPAYLQVDDNWQTPHDDLDVRRAEAANLCHGASIWVDKDGKPVSGMGGTMNASYNQKITGYHHDAKGLVRAFDWAKQELSTDLEFQRIHGEHSINDQALCDLYRLSVLLGRASEADQYLSQIREKSTDSAKDLLRWVESERFMGNVPTSELKP